MKKNNFVLTLVMTLFILTQSVIAQDAVYNSLDRATWKAAAPPYSPTDAVMGGDVADAKYLLDNKAETFLALVKPGKTYGGITGPATIEDLGFTVDFGSSQKFNYFEIYFRSNNSIDYLRPWEISIYGSTGTQENPNDRTWVLITDKSGNTKIKLPNAEGAGTNRKTGPIELENAASYTSVKVVYTGMSPSTSGSTLQVGEFFLGSVSYDKVIDKPEDISFGDVMQGASSSKELTVKGANISSPFTYQLGGADAAAFTVTPGDWSSASGKAVITFSPTSKKIYNATLTINSTGVLEAQTIALTGNSDFELPVKLSSDTNEYWYYIQFARQSAAGTVLTIVDPSIEGDTIRQVVLDNQNSKQLWKITGTWDNYSLVNKSNQTMSFVHVPKGEDPSTGLPIPEISNYFVKPVGSGDKFGFVRYGTTETWQLKNTSSTVADEVNRLYLNDQAGKKVGGYILNNPGNQLNFISADAPAFVVPGDTVKLGSVNQFSSEVFNVLIKTVKLTQGVTATISKNEDNVFTLNTTTLPVDGGQIEINFAPTAYKKVSYATITLTSGSLTHSFVVSASSDVGISKYYVGTAAQWGTRTDGEVVEIVPTALKAGDKVWIAEGEYTTGQIVVPNDVEISGSFKGTETTLEQRAVGSKPWEFANPTVLKNSSSLILSISGANTLVDGITFEGTEVTGRAIQNTNPPAKGGIIRNSIMRKFNSKADGGAMNIRYQTEVYNCLITENTANKGGAAYFDQVTIHDCEITNNSVPMTAAKPIGNVNGGGGGLLLAPEGDGCRAYNLFISGNEASFGGGVYVRSKSKLYNSVIVNNTAQTSGSGIVFDERDNNATVYNVTVADNKSVVSGGAGVCFTADATNRTQNLYNSILYNNTDGYGDIYNIGVNESGAGKATPEIKNIIIDDLDYYAGVNPNLAITNGVAEEEAANLFVTGTWVTNDNSPGKDKGFIELVAEIIDEVTGEVTPAVNLEFATGKDMAGGQRIVATIDIGPYENQVGASVGTIQSEFEGKVIDTKYFNLQGIEVGVPQTTGVYIKRELFESNKVRATKVLIVKEK